MNWTIEGSGVRGQASVVRGLLVVPLLTGVSWPSPKEQRRPATSTEQLTTDNHLLTFANREVAVNRRYDAQHHRADVGIFTTSSKRGAVLDLRLGNKTLLRRKINLSPDRPFQKRVSVPREHPAADWPELSIAHGDNRRERPGRAPGKMDECARAAGSCAPPGRSDFPVTHPGAALADSLASG